MNQPRSGDRVPSRAEDNAAMLAAANTLVETARLATLAVMPPQALEMMGPVGIAGASVQASITAVLRTKASQEVTTYDALAFVVGLALGEILRNASALDLGPVIERLGEGVGHAMMCGVPQPTGMKQ